MEKARLSTAKKRAPPNKFSDKTKALEEQGSDDDKPTNRKERTAPVPATKPEKIAEEDEAKPKEKKFGRL